ncbi:MAG: tRNA (adenosine(37)-N6)-threonylcarbamoyltransferase complex dimerization subunit type 1 TsaB [Acidobacteriota bacterium]
MGAILSLAGCGPRLEVALRLPDAATSGLVALAGPTPRSELIVAAIDLLLRAARISPHDVETVAVTCGPGSFTGIRVALATAQGIAHGAGARIAAFPSLLVQAARAGGGPCLAVQPARRGSVYAQVFAPGHPIPSARGDVEVRAVASLLEAEAPVMAPDGLALDERVSRAAPRVTTCEALATLVGVAEASPPVPLYVDDAPARARGNQT